MWRLRWLRGVGEHVVQRIRWRLPAVLCRQHALDPVGGRTDRTKSAGMGDQRLFRGIRHKRAVVADPEAERDCVPQSGYSDPSKVGVTQLLT
jgi:hypothetical protein